MEKMFLKLIFSLISHGFIQSNMQIKILNPKDHTIWISASNNIFWSKNVQKLMKEPKCKFVQV